MERMINENHVSDITQKPELFQMNNAPVNPSLEKYIFKGKTCTMDDRLYNAFCAGTGKTVNLSDTISVIVKVFGIFVLASVFIPIISIVIQVIQRRYNDRYQKTFSAYPPCGNSVFPDTLSVNNHFSKGGHN